MQRHSLFVLCAYILSSSAYGRIIDVSASKHICVVFDSGKAKCWGANSSGELGIGSPQVSVGGRPGEMATLPNVMVGDTEQVTSISTSDGGNSGNTSTCAVLDSGGAKCWGANVDMSLGFAPTRFSIGRRRADMGDSLLAVPIPYKNSEAKVIQLANGPSQKCALYSDSTLYCWGYNYNGVLGVESAEYLPFDTPEKFAGIYPVQLGSDFHTVQVALSSTISCALSQEGAVKCWGLNRQGEGGLLGLETEVYNKGSARGDMGSHLKPVKFGTGEVATKVQVARNTGCVLLASQKIKCWGLNQGVGLLGVKDANYGRFKGTMDDSLPSIDLGKGNYAKDLNCAGDGTTCCATLETARGERLENGDLRMDGDRLKCWGTGMLGLEDSKARGNEAEDMGENLPYVNLGTDTDHTIERVSVSAFTTCVLFGDGRLKCWGQTLNGVLTEQLPFNSKNPVIGDDLGEMGDALPYLHIKE